MKINNNIQALNAYRNLHKNQFSTSKNLEKLSSGLRINRAADDAAGLAISEKMRSQIRGLKMAERNAMDGISLLQTAEGAMQEVHAMLQRMRELAVQGANDTNTDQDRAEIQKEIRQLLTEIDSVAEKTEFNTRKLLNGSSAVLSVVNQNFAGLVGLPEVIDPAIKSGNYAIDVELASGIKANEHIKYQITQPAAGLKDPGHVELDFNIQNQSFGEYTINIRNFNADHSNAGNTGATIEVIGPNGLPIEKRAVAVGESVPAKEQYQTIGGLKIDTSAITGAGTVKVSVELEATFTVSVDRNEEAPSIKKAEVDIKNYSLKVPTTTVGSVEADTTVSDLMEAVGPANAIGLESFPADRVAVLSKVQITNELDKNASGADVLLQGSAAPVNGFVNENNLSEVANAIIVDTFTVDHNEVAINKNALAEVIVQSTLTAALAGKTNQQITDATFQNAEAYLADRYKNEGITKADIDNILNSVELDESIYSYINSHGVTVENVTLIQAAKQSVEVAASKVTNRDKPEATYFTVTNEDGTKRVFRIAENELGTYPGTEKATVLSTEGVGLVSVNSSQQPVTLADIREALASVGYSGIEAWKVEGAGQQSASVTRDMLLITNDPINGSAPISDRPFTIDTTDYQPTAFKKTLQTKNGSVEHGG
ncbi:flagellin N-terminal helical domain-containing protein [Halalkalibacter krulwichiae]|uniref:Flagellin n=3 Tax=Halalkalibacter krulwichiae TaxID=199441 RepID=A0A1X9MA11_9BACI|nr:hypothetical protein [Halalkalibacter krulwichiae]ARK29430.1 Flagellin [Halalkalibacter krulwichiae]